MPDDIKPTGLQLRLLTLLAKKPPFARPVHRLHPRYVDADLLRACEVHGWVQLVVVPAGNVEDGLLNATPFRLAKGWGWLVSEAKRLNFSPQAKGQVGRLFIRITDAGISVLEQPTADEPNLILGTIAAERYHVTADHLSRLVRQKKLTDYRKKPHGRSKPLELDEREIAKRFHLRESPLPHH
jgi:hypothetical protein